MKMLSDLLNASTRLGVRPRSRVPCIRSVRATTPRPCQLDAPALRAIPFNAIPDDKWGWPSAPVCHSLKMPWDPKDTLSGQIAFAEGASKYVAFTYGNRALHRDDGIFHRG